MAKFILDTDKLVFRVEGIDSEARRSIIINGLSDAHRGLEVEDWLTPYQEKNKRGMSGTGPYSPMFDKFWEAYPARNGKKAGKRPAFKVWVKVVERHQGDEEIILFACIKALEWQKQHEDWTKNNGTYIPMASTYLNAEGWADEKPKDGGSGNKIAKTY